MNSATINSNGTVLVHGGTFDAPDTVTINTSGLLDIRDGVVSNSNPTIITGAGRIVQTAGLLTLHEGGDTAACTINVDMEISGGTNIIRGSTFVGSGGVATEVTVVGRGPTISWQRLNQQSFTGNSGTFRFVLDAQGVSKIDVVNFMSLPSATVIVDGANFNPLTGSTTNIVLFDSPNFASLASESNLIYTNFHPAATLEFVQEDVEGRLHGCAGLVVRSFQ